LSYFRAVGPLGPRGQTGWPWCHRCGLGHDRSSVDVARLTTTCPRFTLLAGRRELQQASYLLGCRYRERIYGSFFPTMGSTQERIVVGTTFLHTYDRRISAGDHYRVTGNRDEIAGRVIGSRGRSPRSSAAEIRRARVRAAVPGGVAAARRATPPPNRRSQMSRLGPRNPARRPRSVGVPAGGQSGNG
jgi:hypothetical protein